MREKLVLGESEACEDAVPVPTPLVDSGSPSSYTPAVGDVVEFVHEGEVLQGVVYRLCGNDDDGLMVAFSSCEHCDALNKVTVIRKKGSVDFLPEKCKLHDIEDKLKAYFKDAPKSEYKVGDLVEYQIAAGKWVVAKITERSGVVADRQPWRVRVKGGSEYWPFEHNFRPLSGSYAERQAKWVEFHGIKVGSKVKVVRKFEAGEEGYLAAGWDSYAGKRDFQGQEKTITKIVQTGSKPRIQLKGAWSFPYFALEPVKD